MYQESYTLPNKERIRVSEIYRIDNMKDRGEGRHNPSFYKWSFLITFNRENSSGLAPGFPSSFCFEDLR